MKRAALFVTTWLLGACSDWVWVEHPDAGDCYVLCQGALPYCGPDHECAACLDDSQCSGATPVCSTASPRTCISECTVDSDCTDPARSTCAAHRCVAACTDTACERFAANPMCDEASGRCVECFPASEVADCVDVSCNRATLACTYTGLGSLARCGMCQADSECAPGSYCVTREHDGVAIGAYCLPARPMIGCGDVTTNPNLRPFAFAVAATSVDGVAVTVCAPRPSISCEAVNRVGISCPAPASPDPRYDACGLAALQDGACVAPPGGTSHCTYICASANDCRTGTSCTPSSSLGPTVCQ